MFVSTGANWCRGRQVECAAGGGGNGDRIGGDFCYNTRPMKRVVIMVAMLGAAVAVAGPLCEDERAALNFLDFVTGPMSAADEKEWWDIGGRQFGIFSKRYQIAFSGYAAAAFLAAAARANDDPVTAARLEKAVDRSLIRPNGLYYLNLDSTWRIGATAHRIISLAESNGSRFRDLR